MFVPVNRYIHVKIDRPEQDLDDYDIVLPDDYNPKEDKHIVVNVVDWSSEVRFAHLLKPGIRMVIDQSMVEEISINNETISIILDNYVVGLLDD
jgi:hypothetical protein|tara:strand:+ start:400 stop:681 length:282 start_codon:yes stop_codon:yes gene_type:complete